LPCCSHMSDWSMTSLGLFAGYTFLDNLRIGYFQTCISHNSVEDLGA
jgi:hypothetical protein